MAIPHDTPKAEITLKDKFVTQSALDIQRKCKNWLLALKEPWRSSYELPIGYITNKTEKEAGKKKKSEALVVALCTMSDQTS